MTCEKAPCKTKGRGAGALAKDYFALMMLYETMKNSRDHYETLYENAPAGYIVLDQKGYIKDINSIGVRMLGTKKSSILNLPLSAYIVQTNIKDFLNHLRNCNKSSKIVQSEVTLVHEHREVQLSSTKISADGQVCLSTIIVDVNEKNKIEREVAQLDCLHLVGEMAAGIAHEIRNPLTTVLGYLQIFQKKPQLSDYCETFSLMANELLQANVIITEFLSFAKDKTFTPAYFDLNQIVADLYPLINAEALMQGKSISIELTDALPLVLIDKNEIRQVVLELTRNGLQAMAKGMIRIRTYIERDNVVLAIQDHGLGIPKDVQAKIGIPFFTTKATGTGLGLPACYSIAARHNVKLKFETGSEGTTFFMKFGPEVIWERCNPMN